MSYKKVSKSKVCSITEMAKSLNLSRARFYQLLKQNIFPQPLYSIHTKRPFYNEELQLICQEIRESGIGHNEEYVLFYSPRKYCPNQPASNSPKRKITNNSKYQELVDTLNSMGLNVSNYDVDQAVRDCK